VTAPYEVTPVTPEEDIVYCYTTLRMTIGAIAGKFGVSYGRVRAVLRAAEVPVRLGPRPKRALDVLAPAYRADIGSAELARLFGCHQVTVAKRVRKAGGKLRNRGYPKADIDVDALLYAYEIDGLTQAQCGQRFGVSATTARRYLVAAGAAMRPSVYLR
jgi:DNA-directed RNA polymerase specialized sigma24 family protein